MQVKQLKVNFLYKLISWLSNKMGTSLFLFKNNKKGMLMFAQADVPDYNKNLTNAKEIKAYLYFLNREFTYGLQENKIKKGYTVFLPPNTRLKLDMMVEINSFLMERIEANQNYIFYCHSLYLNLDIYHENNNDLYIQTLCQ